ncbi:MAG: ADP-ribosylation factor-like protein, partial [Thermoanaerobaculia bacterium]
MVVYNAATRELTAKIVYYGPGLGGKTTNLQLLHDRLEPGTVGKLLNLATHSDRTIYFDLLPVELGDIKGYKIRFQLATVPGQTAFNETRRVVLKGTDGIVFVADSQWTMLPKNLESWQNLKDNLKVNSISFEGIPIVIQYNKRDLPDILSVDAMQEALGLSSYPFVEAVASAGRGVTETFKLISKLTFVDLLRRLQGRRPDDAAPPERQEQDDLQTWKDSLLNRTAPPAPARSRPLALVPTPTEEAPFDVEEPAPIEPVATAEGPFGEASEEAVDAAPDEPATAQSVPLETVNFRLGVPQPQTSGWDEPPVSEEPVEDLPDAIDFVEETPGPEPSYEVLSHPLETVPELTGFPEVDRPTEVLDKSSLAAASAAPSPEITESVRRLETRLAELEEALRAQSDGIASAEQAVDALSARLEAFERDSRSLGKSLQENTDRLASRLGEVEKAAGPIGEMEMTLARMADSEVKLESLKDRLDGAVRRQRTAEDDVSMALKSLHEKGDRLDGQLGTLAGHLSALEGSLQEKTSQGRREADDIRAQLEHVAAVVEEKTNLGHREAEDIRGQLAPLLENAARRNQTDQEIYAEFDRLRESLAESL